MAINEQIGGSQEAKLLYAISKQLERLNGVASKAASGGGGTGGGGTVIVWTEELWQDVYDIYERPVDWLQLPPVILGEEKIVLSHAVFDHDSNFCALNVTGSNGYTVNWGDGVIENFASGVQANHMYDFNYSGFSGTLTSLGYKQAIVTITPQAGGNLLTANFNTRHALSTANVYSTGWLDCKAVGTNFTSILFGGLVLLVNNAYLQMFDFIGTNNITSTSYMFYNCFSFGKLVQLDTSKVTSTISMFQKCYVLRTVPLFDMSLVTDASNMFAEDESFTIPPFFNLSSLQNGTQMFRFCSYITTVPLFDFQSLTNGTGLFSGVYIDFPFFNFSNLIIADSLFGGNGGATTYPLYDFSKVTSAVSMFSANIRLTTVPLFNFSSLVNGTSLFNLCAALQEVPLFNFGNLTNGTTMFTDCKAIKRFPLFDLHSLTNGTQMFSNCYEAETMPAYNLSSLTNGTQMFQNNISVKEAPWFDLSKLVIGSNMFFGCGVIKTYPLYNFASLTTANGMFQRNEGLESVPFFDLSKVTASNLMFAFNFCLKSVPAFDLRLSVDNSSIFRDCYSLMNVGLVLFNVAANNTSIFLNCYSITNLPALNFSNITTLTTAFSGCASLSSNLIIGMKVTFDVSNNKMSKVALETLFRNLATVTAQTVTITGNWGADTILSKASSGTATGSTTVTLANTISLAVGMRVTGTGIDVAQAVTFQDIGDTVTINTHGIPNDTIVSFPTVVTTTGITVKTLYYVVNSTTNTFQVSLTQGGAPIALTTNGTGTVVYPTYITSINPGINFTISIPAKATGSQTLSFRILDTFKAVAKGWTVTG